MNKYSFCRIVCIVILASLIQAQKNVVPWPLDCEPAMTSAFGDYRSGHFHSGVDMKTWGRIGIPIRSEGDGYVARVGISTRGYGKALYIKLVDGGYRVYGHLSEFGPGIDSMVEAEQYAQKRYAVQVYFKENQLPVKKGQIIAWSGNTGVGFPHLHYEQRTDNNVPRNALTGGIRVKDKRFPLLETLAVKPFKLGSWVNGEDEPLLIPLSKGSGDTFKVAAPLSFFGCIGLAVKGYDMADAADNHFGIYSLSLELDDSLIFKSVRDSFPFDETQQIHLDYDLGLLYAGEGPFYNLYIEAGNRLPFYGRFKPGAGLIRIASAGQEGLRDGKHRLRITASDALGNKTCAMVDLLCEPPSLQVPQFAIKKGNITIKSKGEADIRLKAFDDILQLDLLSSPATDSAPPPLALFSDSEKISTPPAKILSPGKFRFKFRFDKPGVHLFSAVIPLRDSTGSAAGFSKRFLVCGLTPESGGEAFSLDKRAHLKVSANGVTKNACVWIENYSDSIKSTMLNEITVCGPAYVPLPVSQYYDKAVRVSIRAPLERGTALYQLSGGEGWRFLSDKYDGKQGAYYADVSRNLPFGLFSDTLPPAIVLKTPFKNGDTLTAAGLIFNVRDGGAGIGSDRDVVTLSDGNWLLNEYDFKDGSVKVGFKRLAPGLHTLKLTVRDNVNNENQMVISFYRR